MTQTKEQLTKKLRDLGYTGGTTHKEMQKAIKGLKSGRLKMKLAKPQKMGKIF